MADFSTESASNAQAIAALFATDVALSAPPTSAGALGLSSLDRFVHVRTMVNDHNVMRLVLLGHFMPTAGLAALAARYATEGEAALAELTPETAALFPALVASWSAARALVTIQKRAFSSDRVLDLCAPGALTLVGAQENDVYAQFTCAQLPLSQGNTTLDLVFPATDVHIAKATPSPSVLLYETPALYARAHAPIVAAQVAGGRLQWVYNVLEKKKEADRVLFHDTCPVNGFLLAPDTKWDANSFLAKMHSTAPSVAATAVAGVFDPASTVAAPADAAGAFGSTADERAADAKARHLAGGGGNDIYCLALINRRDVQSLRDLTTEHLPMLRNILSTGTRFVSQRFGVHPDTVMCYLHYVPSYYHLHVHFSHVSRVSPDLFLARSHLIADVIDNIERDATFYQRKTLPVRLPLDMPVAKAIFAARDEWPMYEPLPRAASAAEGAPASDDA